MMKSARTSIKNPARKPRPKPAPTPPCESPAPANPTGSFVPYPLFPPIVLLTDHQGLERPINNDVRARLGTLDPALEAFQTWRHGKKRMLGSSCTSSCAYRCRGSRRLAGHVTC